MGAASIRKCLSFGLQRVCVLCILMPLYLQVLCVCVCGLKVSSLTLVSVLHLAVFESPLWLHLLSLPPPPVGRDR